MEVELLPCPFCGGEAIVRTYETESLWSNNQVQQTQVGCETCEYQRATEPGYAPEALEWWNTRVAEDTSSREQAIAAVFKDLRGRKLIKYLFEDDPENVGPYGYIDAPIDLEAQQEMVETLVDIVRAALRPT